MVCAIQLASRIRTEGVPSWSWSCSQAVSKPVWHIPLLCVQWKTPDDGQRNCPNYVEIYSKNKFEELVHPVGFIIRTYHDARSPERQIKFTHALFRGTTANFNPYTPRHSGASFNSCGDPRFTLSILGHPTATTRQVILHSPMRNNQRTPNIVIWAIKWSGPIYPSIFQERPHSPHYEQSC